MWDQKPYLNCLWNLISSLKNSPGKSNVQECSGNFFKSNEEKFDFQESRKYYKEIKTQISGVPYFVSFLFCCVGSKFWHSESLLHHAGSFIVGQKLKFWWVSSGVTACGLSCSVACGILVSQAGTEPMFPALQGRFLTTRRPGKSPWVHWSKFIETVSRMVVARGKRSRQ